MENQHRAIKGYRELSQAEIDLMNEIKTKGVELEALVIRVRAHLSNQEADAKALDLEARTDEQARLSKAGPQRWASMGATHFQEGLMALTRSVAQPTFF